MVKSQVRKFVFHTLCNECSQLKKVSYMRYTKLEQPTNLTELYPKYAQMIFKAKLEMFDMKINLKGLYPTNLLSPFCNVVNEDFSDTFHGCAFLLLDVSIRCVSHSFRMCLFCSIVVFGLVVVDF